MKFANYIIVLATFLTVALFESCRKSTPETPLGEEIEFALSPIVEVKASTLNKNNLKSFGVYAALRKSGKTFNTAIDINDPNDGLENFMDNIPVTDQGGVWYPTPKFYWPSNDQWKLSFFAYTPHNSQHPGLNVPARNNWSDNKQISITYTPDKDPKKHADLCVATAALDKTGGSLVKFDFNHTLAWVTFAAKYRGFVPDNCYLRVDSLTLRNIVGTNTLIYKTNSAEWQTPDYNEKNGIYCLSVNGSETLVKDGINTNEYKDIQNADGYMFLLPQTINATSHTTKTAIDVTFSYIKANDPNNTIIAQFFTTKELPANQELLPSHKYKYVFELDLENVSLISIGLETPAGSTDGKWITDWVPSGTVPPQVTIK